MEIYDSLLKAVHDEYDTLRVLKKSARGEVSLVRHRESGTRIYFQTFWKQGSISCSIGFPAGICLRSWKWEKRTA